LFSATDLLLAVLLPLGLGWFLSSLLPRCRIPAPLATGLSIAIAAIVAIIALDARSLEWTVALGKYVQPRESKHWLGLVAVGLIAATAFDHPGKWRTIAAILGTLLLAGAVTRLVWNNRSFWSDQPLWQSIAVIGLIAIVGALIAVLGDRHPQPRATAVLLSVLGGFAAATLMLSGSKSQAELMLVASFATFGASIAIPFAIHAPTAFVAFATSILVLGRFYSELLTGQAALLASSMIVATAAWNRPSPNETSTTPNGSKLVTSARIGLSLLLAIAAVAWAGYLTYKALQNEPIQDAAPNPYSKL
jgi:hypothetical protein